MKYVFILGNSPDLAKAEITALLSFKEIAFFNQVLVVETETDLSLDFFDRLGGTVKIGKIVEEPIVDFLKNLGKTKIDFGFSSYDAKPPELREIKQELSEVGIKSRFVLPPAGEKELSTVVVKKQKIVELLIVRDTVFVTIWVQDFEGWNTRDYGRPQVQAHIGMLPPKVARQMINLAGGKKILDPFCGVGTVLSEALVLGYEAIGSDIDNRQVSRTNINLNWLGKKAQLFVYDARKISEKVNNIDAIVTEPYLGPNDGKSKDLGLEKLYVDCFLEWKKILKPDGKVVIVLPGFDLDDRLVKNVIDKVSSIGYILCTGPIVYARPQARVKRNICVFKYVTR